MSGFTGLGDSSQLVAAFAILPVCDCHSVNMYDMTT